MASPKNDAAIPADEVEAIIASRVEAVIAERIGPALAKQIESMGGYGAARSDAGDKSWMEGLALAIASIGSQNDRVKPVPPEELAKRVRAREALEELIERTYQAQVTPLYQITAKVFLGEQLIQPAVIGPDRRAVPTEIGWWGIPNEFMRPINPEAEAIHKLFMESIGGGKVKTPKLRITAMGQVVRSGGMPLDGGRDVAAASRAGRDDNGRDAVTIQGRGAVTQPTTRILGTLMPAARGTV